MTLKLRYIIYIITVFALSITVQSQTTNDGWSNWQNFSCHKGLQVQMKHSMIVDKEKNVNYWKFRFRNDYSESISFSFGISNENDGQTNYARTIHSGQVVNDWDYNNYPKGTKLYIIIDKVKLADSISSKFQPLICDTTINQIDTTKYSEENLENTNTSLVNVDCAAEAADIRKILKEYSSKPGYSVRTWSDGEKVCRSLDKIEEDEIPVYTMMSIQWFKSYLLEQMTKESKSKSEQEKEEIKQLLKSVEKASGSGTGGGRG